MNITLRMTTPRPDANRFPDAGLVAASERAERMLLSVEKVSGIGHWVLDLRINALTWSDQVFRIHGYEPRAFIPSLELAEKACHPDDRARASQCLDEAVRTGRGQCFELRIYRADGEQRYLRCNAEPETDRRGNVVALLGTFLDITDARAKEQELVRQAQALEEEVARREALEQDLRMQALTDELTGVPNRRHFMSRAAQEMVRAERYRHPLSVVAFDLDRFKRINDRFGHAAGDRVIREVATRVAGMLRSGSDMLGRLGGEEFAVLLAETDVASALELAQRMRRAVESLGVEHEGTTLSVTCSFGVAGAAPEDPDISSVLGRADAALYRAKSGGRNRVCEA